MNPPRLANKKLPFEFSLSLTFIFVKKIIYLYPRAVIIDVCIDGAGIYGTHILKSLEQFVEHEGHVWLIKLYSLIDADHSEARLDHKYNHGGHEATPGYELNE